MYLHCIITLTCLLSQISSFIPRSVFIRYPNPPGKLEGTELVFNSPLFTLTMALKSAAVAFKSTHFSSINVKDRCPDSFYPNLSRPEEFKVRMDRDIVRSRWGRRGRTEEKSKTKAPSCVFSLLAPPNSHLCIHLPQDAPPPTVVVQMPNFLTPAECARIIEAGERVSATGVECEEYLNARVNSEVSSSGSSQEAKQLINECHIEMSEDAGGGFRVRLDEDMIKEILEER